MLLVVFVRTVGVDKVLFLFAENLLTVSFCTEPYTTPRQTVDQLLLCANREGGAGEFGGEVIKLLQAFTKPSIGGRYIESDFLRGSLQL